VIDDETLDAIRHRAKRLADEAPALTAEQALLLHSLWMRYSTASASVFGGAA
jgi:hypothetical protein